MAPRIQPADHHQPEDDAPRKIIHQDAKICDVTRQSYEERWSDESIRTTVRQWQLTNLEEQQLKELQRRLRDLSHWKNNPQDIVRYLRGPGHFDEGT